MFGGSQRIFVSDVKFIKAHTVEKHIDAAQIVNGDVDFLAEKAVADGVEA